MKIDGINVHPNVTEALVIELCERQMVSLDDPGLCLICGIESGSVEPDARRYPCEACGAPASVYGAQELLFHFVA